MTKVKPSNVQILIPNVTATDIPIVIWNEIGDVFKAMAEVIRMTRCGGLTTILRQKTMSRSRTNHGKSHGWLA